MDTFQHRTMRKNGISIIVITICNIFIKLKRMQTVANSEIAGAFGEQGMADLALITWLIMH